MNMISATGRRPVAAAPTATPRKPILRGAHDSAPRFLDALILAAAAAGDVLAQQDHVRIRLHRDVERLVDRLNEQHLSRHHVTPIAELERSRQS
jgi:hypothetical protein